MIICIIPIVFLLFKFFFSFVPRRDFYVLFFFAVDAVL